MKVKELLAELQKLLDEGKITGDEEVGTEGCDCVGDVGSVRCDEEGVMLERSGYSSLR